MEFCPAEYAVAGSCNQFHIISPIEDSPFDGYRLIV